MAKNSYQLGFSLFECLLGLFLFQVLIFACIPSLQTWIQRKEERWVLNDLQEMIEFARWEALHRHEILYLEPKNADWHNTWLVYSKNKIIRQFSHHFFMPVKIQWHGFLPSQRLIFYPKMKQNRCNGVFQIGQYRLWLNRLGHLRVTDA